MSILCDPNVARSLRLLDSIALCACMHACMRTACVRACARTGASTHLDPTHLGVGVGGKWSNGESRLGWNYNRLRARTKMSVAMIKNVVL